MTIHIIILLLIIILFTVGIIYLTTYNRYQDYIIRINEVEGKIDDCLRDKFDSILRLNNYIKEKIKTKKVLVDDISKLKDEDISSFDMDRKLTEAMNKVNVVKDNLSNKIIVGANNTIEEAANSFAIKIIELGVILLLYLITRLVLRFISALTDLITNLPILKQINKTGGIIYGFIKGIFIVYAILGIIYLISPIISKNAFDIIDNTIITKEIYNNNILLTLIF